MTETLKPFVSEGDKEPSWDGHIYIHSSPIKNKKGLKRVPVQVKGTKVSSLANGTFSHPIERVDLDNYGRNGGAFYFVVQIQMETGEERIFYAELLPLRVREILRDSESDMIPVEMKRFPLDNAQKTTLFLNFFDNMRRQSGAYDIDLKTIDELEQSGSLESITAHVTKHPSDPRTAEDLFDSLETYAYANIRGSNIPVPIPGRITLFKTQVLARDVTVNEKTYYHNITAIAEGGELKTKIGDSIFLTFPSTKELKLTFKPTTIIPNAVNDIEFFLDVVDNGGFKIDGETLLFSNINITDDERNQLNETLDHHREVLRVLELLKITTPIDLTSFTLEDQRNTDRFIESFIKGEAVAGLKEDLPFLTKLDYLRSKIAICFQPTEDKHKYHIFEFFSTPFAVSFLDGEGNNRPTSQFDVLTDDDYLELQNLNIDTVVDSYSKFEPNQFIAERANNTLLMLLSAYDKSNDQRQDILSGAYNLSCYILKTFSDNDLGYSIRFINHAQILRRMNTLDESTQKTLYNISEDENENADIRVAAKLLLGDMFSAKMLFASLPGKFQEALRSYPIFRYWDEEK